MGTGKRGAEHSNPKGQRETGGYADFSMQIWKLFQFVAFFSLLLQMFLSLSGDVLIPCPDDG